MSIIKYRKIFYWFSGILILCSIFSVSFWGLKFGTDFTGGSLLEFKTDGVRIEKSVVENSLQNSGVDLGDFSLREAGDTGYILRSKNINLEQKATVLSKIDAIDEKTVTETKFSDIGPTLGKELRSQALLAIILFWLSGAAVVKGFALVFGIGILFSMLSAVLISKVLLLAISTDKEHKLLAKLFNAGFGKIN